MTAIYRSEGHLTGTIQPDAVSAAQEYLTSDDMTQYFDMPLRAYLVRVQWHLHNDGHNYHVEAITTRELTDTELKQLAQEVSGQNSDGLGEGFEQQDFAEELQEDEADCYNCDGMGVVDTDGEEDEAECPTCWGNGTYEAEYGMISFDWQTNDSTFTRVA